MSYVGAIQLPEPCTRMYLHHPHLIQITGLSNQVQDLVCPGAPAVIEVKSNG